jgi:DNA invertase Pin-like site-specific DNA recombinase
MRCAIYTRKSTDHNLDLAFNSLDAQREACEAYIKSQAHEGWKLIPDRFDDGAFSGASLDRPALQSLIDLIKAKAVDIIVVYKVDRMTRSLADFAKLVELFDAHDVSFVSVTQSFNTTNSMGRLTLNVLLSFAQFEREVIGERVRDKIGASKRRGIWVGGTVPLGYRSVAKKLVVVPDEAALVRRIYEYYLRLGSIGELAAHLEQQGVKPRPRLLADGQMIAAERFMVGPLAHVLKNRFYIGEIAFQGEIHKGEHEPILDRELFAAVQARLAEGKTHRLLARSQSPAALMGMIFDDRGNPMSPSHTNKKGVRYRYYVSHALLQNRKATVGSTPRVGAPDIEVIVAGAIRANLDQPEDLPDGDLFQKYLRRVTVRANQLDIELNPQSSDGEPPRRFTIAFTPNGPRRKGFNHRPASQATIDPETRDTLLQAIARARRWMASLLAGESASFEDIAASENLAERYVRRVAVLACLSPRIIGAIDDGTAPGDLTLSRLTQALPHGWRDQEALLGFA